MMYYIGRFWPVALSAIVVFCFYKLHEKISDVDKIMDKLLATALTVSGTLLGFLLTIVTIITTIDTRRMRFVRQQGQAYVTLQGYMRWAIIANLGTIVVSFMSPVASSFKILANETLYIYYIDVFVIAYTLAASVRFTYVFTNLLHDKE